MNAIQVRNVSKTYRIPHERHTTLIERLLSVFRPGGFEVFAALRGVSLDVAQGEFIGLIGANGSGKSTLLKLMAGLLVPDQGDVVVRGSLSPLLELGLGFHQELSVTENITLYGAVLGYPREEMPQRVRDVLAFAELDRFRDAKLKNLSSGMLMRLAFATALRADADILLLDEVLAVGDAKFQDKCFRVFNDLKAARRTIVLVSHDLASVQRFCNRVVWLDRGRIAMSGTAEEVVGTYLAMSREEALAQASRGQNPVLEVLGAPTQRHGDGIVRFVHGALETIDGVRTDRVPSGSPLVLRLTAEATAASDPPVFGFRIQQLGGLGGYAVYSTNSALLGTAPPPMAPGDRVEIRIVFTAALLDGRYAVTVAVAPKTSTAFHDWINDYLTFTVEGSRCHEGVADLGASMEYLPAVGEQRTGTAWREP